MRISSRSDQQRIALCWNWKTALFSANLRAVLFAGVTPGAGRAWALRAFLIELAFGTALAGFQGALSQAMRGIKPSWRATPLCASAVAIINQPIEFLLHSSLHTPNVPTAIFFSLAYTLVATRCSLYLMRHGLFVSGVEGRPLGEDLKRLPVVFARFLGFLPSTQRARGLEHF